MYIPAYAYVEIWGGVGNDMMMIILRTHQGDLGLVWRRQLHSPLPSPTSNDTMISGNFSYTMSVAVCCRLLRFLPSSSWSVCVRESAFHCLAMAGGWWKPGGCLACPCGYPRHSTVVSAMRRWVVKTNSMHWFLAQILVWAHTPYLSWLGGWDETRHL